MEAKWFGWVFALLVAMHAGGVAAQAKAVFPEELRGQWDDGRSTCKADESTDSDMRLEIGVDYRHQGEDRSELVSITRISNSPKAWRVRLKSGLIEGKGAHFNDIYVGGSDRLIISDGENAHVYNRCK